MIHLTVYRGAKDATPIAQDDMPWDELVSELTAAASETAKDKTALLAVSPVRLREPRRLDANVESITALAIDVDRCDIATLVERLDASGWAALVYGSPSDDANGAHDARRVRVVAPITRELAPSECRATRLAFAEALGLTPGCGAEKALDPSRIFFVGRVDGTPEREVITRAGAPVDVDALLGAPLVHAWGTPASSERIASSSSDDATLGRARALAERLPPSVSGYGGDEALMIAARELATVLDGDAAAIESILVETFNPRCAPPWDAAKLRREATRAAKRFTKLANDPLRKSLERRSNTPAAEGNAAFALGIRHTWNEPDEPLAYAIAALGVAPGEGKITLIAGEPGCAKGPIADYLALCLATGAAALGDMPTQKAKVLLLDCEGWRLTMRRIRRLARGHGIDPSAFADSLDVLDTSSAHMLSDVWLASLRAHVREHGIGAIVLDSYTSAMLASGLEANQPEFATLAKSLGTLGVVVIAVAHSNKAAALRAGEPKLADVAYSGALVAMAQTAIMVRRDAKDVIEISCARAPETRFDTFSIRFVDVPGGALRVERANSSKQEKSAAKGADRTHEQNADKLERALRDYDKNAPGGAASAKSMKATTGLREEYWSGALDVCLKRGTVKCVAGERGAVALRSVSVERTAVGQFTRTGIARQEPLPASVGAMIQARRR